MPRGKAQKKSSMRGKRGMESSRSDEREMGKKVAGETGRRAATSSARGGQFEEGSTRTRRMAARGGRASQGASKSAGKSAGKGAARRTRKSDI